MVTSTFPGPATALAKPDSRTPGFPVAVSMRCRLVFQLPVPGKEPVEMKLFASDGTLAKRARYRKSPVALDATALPPGGYLAEFSWWDGQRERMERVPVSL